MAPSWNHRWAFAKFQSKDGRHQIVQQRQQKQGTQELIKTRHRQGWFSFARAKGERFKEFRVFAYRALTGRRQAYGRLAPCATNDLIFLVRLQELNPRPPD